MAEPDLLGMLATEADRRCKLLIEGAEALAASADSDPARVEALRVEAHGLKGAAMVVREDRLAELALRLEKVLAEHTESGRIETGLAATIVAAASALQEGAQAAAEGVGEPSSVGESLDKLGS
jgi:chemotaxis protein histidine kinase CheA